MRLINTDTFELHEFFDTNIPQYAILSHRWEGDEVSYQDYLLCRKRGLHGDRKIRSFCKIAKTKYEYQWAWIDTCCIDKSSSAELSEAINSMYRWYMKAGICVVYMSDVSTLEDFETSKWFTRGWTLQELLAPHKVDFYSMGWDFLGTRDELAVPVSRTTTIRADLLRSMAPETPIRHYLIRQVCVAEKMSWASKRITSRLEDMAYCLLGLFDTNMPLLYGEGEKAFQRLQQEILTNSDDESIFAWTSRPDDLDLGILAPGPGNFLGGSVRRLRRHDFGARELSRRKPYDITNRGLRIEAHLIRLKIDQYNIQRYGIPIRCALQPSSPSSATSSSSSSSLLFPLVLPLSKDTDDPANHKYTRYGPGPINLTKEEWDPVLQGWGYENFDLHLSRLPKHEIFISLDPSRRLDDSAHMLIENLLRSVGRRYLV